MRTLGLGSVALAFVAPALASPTPTIAVDASGGFLHPGLLHTEDDFDRIKGFIETDAEPFVLDWVKLNSRANPNYVSRPLPTIYRGINDEAPQNYARLFNEMTTAYVLAVRWKLGGGDEYAAAAARILDAWSSTLVEIRGSEDRFLAAGLQGYQAANAAEILREYSGWNSTATINMLVNIFYKMNHDFITEHWGAPIDFFWANWDLANIASMMAIGVVADDRKIWDEAIDYFKNGKGMGAIENAIWAMHKENCTGKVLGQNQEAGRDQGHAILDFALLGVIGQQAYSQGVDLWGYLDNRILAGAEYMAKYNLGHDVPFTTYVNSVHGTQTVVSAVGRGQARPIGELLYAHYASVKGLDASWIGAYRDFIVEKGNGSEGGVGFYGTNSNGFDQLGFGTLLFRREA